MFKKKIFLWINGIDVGYRWKDMLSNFGIVLNKKQMNLFKNLKNFQAQISNGLIFHMDKDIWV